MPEIDIAPLSDSPRIRAALSEILIEIVANAGSVSFMHPLAHEAADAFWAGSLAAAARDERIVLGAFDGENLVIISSPFFPHKLSKGYGNPISRVLESINGKHVNNLNHAVELLRDARDEFITIAFAGRGVESLVFARKETLAATEEILTDNGVRYQGSPDTLAVWARTATAASKQP